MIFADPDEVICAFDAGHVSPHARIKVRIDGQLVSTTPGRIIIREIVLEEVPFDVYNREMSKKVIGRLVGEAYRHIRHQGHGHSVRQAQGPGFWSIRPGPASPSA